MKNLNPVVQAALEEMSKQNPEFAIACEEVRLHPWVERATRDFETDLEEYDEY